MHALTDSMEVAALFVVAIAKADGEITRETKLAILSLFESEFGVKRSRSIEMFSASAYMLQDVVNMPEEVKMVLSPSKSTFQHTHIETLSRMMNRVANLELAASNDQLAIIHTVEAELSAQQEPARQW